MCVPPPFELIPPLPHRQRPQATYNILIHSAIYTGLPSGPLPILQEMSRAEVTPNSQTWAAISVWYGKQGKARDALAFLARLKAAGICPDMTCHLSVMKACAREGEWRRRVWEEMLQAKVSEACSGRVCGGVCWVGRCVAESMCAWHSAGMAGRLGG